MEAKKLKAEASRITRGEFRKMDGVKKYSPQQLAKTLGVKLNTVNRWRDRGAGPAYYKVGGAINGKVFYLEGDILEWKLFSKFSPRSVGRPKEKEVLNIALGCLDWTNDLESAAGQVLIRCWNRNRNK